MASILPSWRSGSSQLDLRMGRPVYSASHAQARLHPLVPGAYLPRGPDSKQTPNIMSGNWGSPRHGPPQKPHPVLLHHLKLVSPRNPCRQGWILAGLREALTAPALKGGAWGRHTVMGGPNLRCAPPSHVPAAGGTATCNPVTLVRAEATGPERLGWGYSPGHTARQGGLGRGAGGREFLSVALRAPRGRGVGTSGSDFSPSLTSV